MMPRRPFIEDTASGFTLAELVVATTLITIVMTAVYTAFGAAVRTCRTAEANQGVYQESRVAISTLTHELNCIVGGSEHLFEGENDQVEFYAVTPPMNVEKGEGPHVLWIRYKYNRTGHRLERTEAIVKGPLPMQQVDERKPDKTRVKLGTKYDFALATNVRGFKVEYYRMPPQEPQDTKKGPEYIEPVVMKRNKQGWGLPQGIKITLTVEDSESPTKETTFTAQTTFRIPQPLYDEKGMEGAAIL